MASSGLRLTRNTGTGAAPTTAMMHIALQEAFDGKVIEWMEKVSEEESKEVDSWWLRVESGWWKPGQNKGRRGDFTFSRGRLYLARGTHSSIASGRRKSC